MSALKVTGYTLAAAFVAGVGVAGLEPLNSQTDQTLGLDQHFDQEMVAVVEDRAANDTIKDDIAVHFDRAGIRAVASAKIVSDKTTEAVQVVSEFAVDAYETGKAKLDGLDF